MRRQLTNALYPPDTSFGGGYHISELDASQLQSIRQVGLIVISTILTHLTFLGYLRCSSHLRSRSLLYQDPHSYDADPDLCSTGKDGSFYPCIRCIHTYLLLRNLIRQDFLVHTDLNFLESR